MNIKEIEKYLEKRIGNWYKVAFEDYGVTGKFVSAIADGENLVILSKEEDGYKTKVIEYYEEYEKENIYNIWMEG